MSKPFDFIIPLDSIGESQRELIVKAHDAANEAFKKNKNHKGSILCQLWLKPEESEVRIRGTFIPHEYASRIDDVLTEAVKAKKP